MRVQDVITNHGFTKTKRRVVNNLLDGTVDLIFDYFTHGQSPLIKVKNSYQSVTAHKARLLKSMLQKHEIRFRQWFNKN